MDSFGLNLPCGRVRGPSFPRRHFVSSLRINHGAIKNYIDFECEISRSHGTKHSQFWHKFWPCGWATGQSFNCRQFISHLRINHGSIKIPIDFDGQISRSHGSKYSQFCPKLSLWVSHMSEFSLQTIYSSPKDQSWVNKNLIHFEGQMSNLTVTWVKT